MPDPIAGEAGERLRFAREIVRELSPMLRAEPEGSPYDIGLHGGCTKILIDEILLDVAPEKPRIVVLFRDIAKPDHLYRLSIEAVDSEVPYFDAAVEAGTIWANFCESIEGGPGMRAGSPTRITDIEW